SVPLFLTFILLTTLRFEILNKSFLFGTLERNNVYTKLPMLLASSFPNDPNLPKEDRIEYAEFAKNISPQVVKPLIEDNLAQAIDFINGESKDINLSFALNGVGFENSTGIRWSLSELPDKNLQQSIKMVNGAGNILIIAWTLVLTILVGLFFIEGKTILLIGGIYITAISLVIKLGLLTIGKELDEALEPSQKLLGLLTTSLFPEITTTWLLIGIMLILIWIFMKLRRYTT
ncbi:MAG: hypothetical protein Q7R51_03350, partial [bacterium]|nr:hypothetical protein [bacterium]